MRSDSSHQQQFALDQAYHLSAAPSPISFGTTEHHDRSNSEGNATFGSQRPSVEGLMRSSQSHALPPLNRNPAPNCMSPFSEYGFAYKSSPGGGSAPFATSSDDKASSPSPSAARAPGGLMLLPCSSDKPTMSTSGQFTCNINNASPDESDATSPLSAREQHQPMLGEYLIDDGQKDQSVGDTKVKKKKVAEIEKPAWSELKTKAGKERKRLPLACIACRRKKIRCSGEKPACKHCLRSRIPCVYKVTARKAQPRTDYMAMLDKRLKRMEERVIKLIPDKSDVDMAAIGRAVIKPVPPNQAARAAKLSTAKKRSAAEAFSGQVKDWSRPISSSNDETTSKSSSSSSREIEEHKLQTEGSESLPSIELQEHLAEVFFDSVYGQAYHLLHKPSYMRRLRARTLPPVLILAVCAVSARFSTHPLVSTEPAFLRGEQWAAPAREIALKRYDQPNITILTVLLMLGLHEFGTCQGGRSWMLGGMAMRMAYALQLHQELDHDPLSRKGDKKIPLSFTDREIRRRTMWACFIMDRFNSSGTDRPMCATEEEIKIQLPIKESHFQMEIPGPTETLDGSVPNPTSPGNGQISNPEDNMGVAAYTIRAIALWGEVVKYFNLGGKQKDSYPCWHPDSRFSALTKQIKGFKDSLPSFLQYSQDNLRIYAADRLANQYIFLHICYQQIILFMHRYAIPMSPGVRPPVDIPKPILAHSVRQAIEAANQISILVSQAVDYSVNAPFAGYSAFLSSTVHVWGAFSHNPQLEAHSKKCLAQNVKYLSRMKRHWGMFHYMAESLKGIYRRFADASLQGVDPQKGDHPAVFQYGDWFDEYPHGLPETDYEDSASITNGNPSNEAVMSQKSDLQTVEDFFRSLSPASKPEKLPARKREKKAGKRKSIASQQCSQGQQQFQQQSTMSQLSVQGQSSSDMSRSVQDMFNHSIVQSQAQSTQPQPSLLATSFQSPQISSTPNSTLFSQHPHQQSLSQPSTMQQQALIPAQSQTMTSMCAPEQSSTIPQLDRHMAYTGYSSMGSAAQYPSFSHMPSAFLMGDIPLPDPNLPSGAVDWSSTEAFWSEPSSAYFTPFNIEPPNVGRTNIDWSGCGVFGAGMGMGVGMEVVGSCAGIRNEEKNTNVGIGPTDG